MPMKFGRLSNNTFNNYSVKTMQIPENYISDPRCLTDKIIIVTGAGDGIGRVLVDLQREHDALDTLAVGIQRGDGRHHVLRAGVVHRGGRELDLQGGRGTAGAATGAAAAEDGGAR